MYDEDYNFERFNMVSPSFCADSKNVCTSTNIAINMAASSNPKTSELPP